MNESKYTINFKATKRLFNLFNLRMTHSINVDVEALEEGISTDERLEDIQYVINEYAKLKNLSNIKLINYTRHV